MLAAVGQKTEKITRSEDAPEPHPGSAERRPGDVRDRVVYLVWRPCPREPLGPPQNKQRRGRPFWESDCSEKPRDGRRSGVVFSANYATCCSITRPGGYGRTTIENLEAELVRCPCRDAPDRSALVRKRYDTELVVVDGDTRAKSW